MFSAITMSVLLAFGAPVADEADADEAPSVEYEQTVSETERLSSDEIARIRTGDVPSDCEVFWLPDPVTGELRCDAVVCGWGSSIHECSEFGL